MNMALTFRGSIVMEVANERQSHCDDDSLIICSYSVRQDPKILILDEATR